MGLAAPGYSLGLPRIDPLDGGCRAGGTAWGWGPSVKVNFAHRSVRWWKRERGYSLGLAARGFSEIR